MIRVDQQGLAQLPRGTRHLTQDEDAGTVRLAGEILLRDQVHTVS